MTNSVDNGELIHFLYRAVDEPGALEEFMRRLKRPIILISDFYLFAIQLISGSLMSTNGASAKRA